MSDRVQMEKTLREAYAARQSGNLEAIERCFAPQLTFVMAGAPHMSPVAARIETLEGFREHLRLMIQTFVITHYDIRTILIDGDQAAVHWQASVRSSVTGEVLTTDLCDLVAFKDGRIVSFTEFCDTAAAAKLMGR